MAIRSRPPLNLLLTLGAIIAFAPACSPDSQPTARPASPPRAAPPIPPAIPLAVASTRAASGSHARSFAEFRPSRHGFRFTNRFTGSPLPFSLGGLEKYINIPNNYGLCGGMSFAAADYFLARLDPPALLDPPAKGEDLYEYLYSRQLDSLGDSLGAVPTFAHWMNLPDSTACGTGFRTFAGLAELIRRVQSGEPTHLGLVLGSFRDGGKLWENHQVLAYAVESIPNAPAGVPGLLISIYDPNFPSNDGAALHVMWRSPGPLILGAGVFGGAGTNLLTVPCPGVDVIRRAPGRRDTPVRGFFMMTYTPRTPPRG